MQFDNWMKPCRFAGVDGSVLVLTVPNKGFKEICERSREQVLAASRALAMPLSDVVFIVRSIESGAGGGPPSPGQKVLPKRTACG